jgi:hypothetical protein
MLSRSKIFYRRNGWKSQANALFMQEKRIEFCAVEGEGTKAKEEEEEWNRVTL